MLRAAPGLAFVALFALLSSPCSAQVYTVRADGTGDFDDLQVALDTVPAGSSLIVAPVRWDAVVVQRAVTIQGTTDASGSMTEIDGFVTYSNYDFEFNEPACVEIDADTASEVRLINLHLVGKSGQVGDMFSPCGVLVRNAGRLIVESCEIDPLGWDPDGNETSIPVHGIELDCFTAPLESLVIRASTVHGADSQYVWFDAYYWVDPPKGTVGGDAVTGVPPALVLVADSTLAGGRGADYWLDCSTPGDQPPDVYGGDGGAGIGGFTGVFASNSVFTGGLHGQSFTNECGSTQTHDGADGPGVDGSTVDLPNLLTISGTPAIGTALTLAGAGFSPYRVALLFVSVGVGDPIRLRQGEWFLGPSFFFAGYGLTDVAGSFTLAGVVPDDLALVGTPLVLQVADTEHVSEPEVVVVRDG